ncbi:MAG: 5'-methylthioadenosine/adenosylhomocysteine nucleosidase [Candidatus Izemoplasmatales bacterium]|jgi:adenosylhomocysteine nucleosidase
MIAIIAAMDKELHSLLDQVTIFKTEVVAEKTFFVGTLSGKDVIIAKSGIGKVNAAVTTAILLDHYAVDFVINTGLAGGIAPAKSGDIVIAADVAYSDVDFRVINPELSFGQMEGEPFLVASDIALIQLAKEVLVEFKIDFQLGTLVSGDQFVTSKKKIKMIMDNVDTVIACEMEGMAVALTCYHFKTPFIIIRGVSDMIDATKQVSDYYAISTSIAKKTTDFVIRFIEKCQWNK